MCFDLLHEMIKVGLSPAYDIPRKISWLADSEHGVLNPDILLTTQMIGCLRISISRASSLTGVSTDATNSVPSIFSDVLTISMVSL